MKRTISCINCPEVTIQIEEYWHGPEIDCGKCKGLMQVAHVSIPSFTLGPMSITPWALHPNFTGTAVVPLMQDTQLTFTWPPQPKSE